MDEDITEKFRESDTSDFPDFYSCKTVLEKALWVLWVAKEKIGIKALSSEQIALVIRNVKEVSISERSIANAFGKAGDKIHVYTRMYDSSLFEIMKTGKDILKSKGYEDIEVFYFESGNHYTSKRILSNNLMHKINGNFAIVDPYCDVRTLDVLREVKNRKVKLITQLDKLRPQNKETFLRHLKDFKTEYNHVEFRNYQFNDIHDRYILSADSLIILGHSIKDLGSKETFAIWLNEKNAKNIIEELSNNFDRRWTQSVPI
jgi:hypothetical protein